METLGNISYHQAINFGSSENNCLLRFQTTDYQHWCCRIFSSTFTGKELDAETGYSYFGARYLDHELLTSWLSVDPMADKYPNISPYAYCAWNPVKLVDPEGSFPVEIHICLVEYAFFDLKINEDAKKKILKGVGYHSDFWNMTENTIHFDNMNGFESIKELYKKTVDKYGASMKKEDYIKAGEALHALADFYSHSNYIELYSGYAKENGMSLSIEDIKTFSEMMDDDKFIEYVNSHGGLRTGTFSLMEWVREFFLGPKENSHTLMSLDSTDYINGRQLYDYSNPNSPTRYEAALTTAQTEIIKIINSSEEK